MQNRNFTKEKISFVVLFLMLIASTAVLMTACQPSVTPSSPGVATVTKTPSVINTPTITNTPSSVTIGVGDVSLIGMITSSGDQFAFVCLAAIPANAQIFFTNTPWDATNLAFVTGGTGRGIITWAPTSITPIYTEIYVTAGTAGSAFNVTTGAAASGFTGTLTLKTGEDQLYVYQGTVASPTFISAMGVFSGAAGVYTQPSAWHTGGSPPAAPPTNGPYGELPAGLATGAGTSIAFNSLSNGANLAREWVYQCNDVTGSDSEANIIAAINTSAPVSDYVAGAWVAGTAGVSPVSIIVGNSMGTTLAGASTAFPTTGIPLCTSGYTW